MKRKQTPDYNYTTDSHGNPRPRATEAPTDQAVPETAAETLYGTLTAAGIEIDNHESNLYFPVSKESTAILARFPLNKANAQVFRHTTTKRAWYDVPFAFVPFWEAKQKNAAKFTETTAPQFSAETGVCIQCVTHTHRLCLGVPCKCERCSSPGGHADPEQAILKPGERAAAAVRVAAALDRDEARHTREALVIASNRLHAALDALKDAAQALTSAGIMPNVAEEITETRQILGDIDEAVIMAMQAQATKAPGEKQ